MEPIMPPVSLDLIKAELTPSKKLRDTNKGSNEIYVVNHFDSPNIMLEIGRLREEAFRDSGGGSGLAADIDDFDTMEIVKPSTAKYLNVEINSHLEGETEQMKVTLRFKLTDDGWRLDNPTY